jgi:hypothetical protein
MQREKTKNKKKTKAKKTEQNWTSFTNTNMLCGARLVTGKMEKKKHLTHKQHKQNRRKNEQNGK